MMDGTVGQASFSRGNIEAGFQLTSDFNHGRGGVLAVGLLGTGVIAIALSAVGHW